MGPALHEVRLADKIRYLREVEGNLRGLDRAMTQQELVRAIQEENSSSRKSPGTISQSYISQIESGARPHLTNTTRLLLAKFFKVHPGYLVDDPEGYQSELLSDVRNTEDKLDLWLVAGAERFRRDPELCQSLLSVANHHDSRRCLLLMEAIIETPKLLDRLFDVLRPLPNGLSRDAAANKLPAKQSLGMKTTTMRTQKGAAKRKRK